MSTLRLVLLGLFVLAMGLGYGCSDQCTQTCLQGESRCSAQGLLLCTQDAATGCFAWGLLPCGAGQSCVTSAQGQHECSGSGGGQTNPDQCQNYPRYRKQCIGTAVYWFDACGAQRDFIEMCAAGTTCSNGLCQQGGNQSSCTQGQNLCAANTRRCVGAGVQSCVTNAAQQCTHWGPTQNCPAGQYCQNGTCQAAPSNCQNRCQAGQNRCVGSALQVCEGDPVTRCLRWSNLKSCPSGQYCQGGACKGAPGTCQNQCQAGQTKCSGTSLQACIADAQGCLNWGNPTPCPTGQTCQNGVCQTPNGNCQNQCQSGQTRCAGAALQSCQNAANGCLDWAAPTPCPTGQTCKNGKCEQGSDCQDQCREGDQQCAGLEVQSCQRQGKCTVWTRSNTCGANQECKASGGKASCSCKSGFKPTPDGQNCEPDNSSNLDCGMNAEEKGVHQITNQERAKIGLPPLKCHAAIVRESREWSKKQCARGRIGHEGADSRIRATGLSWSTWGENVAAGQTTPASVMRAWMNSSGHRKNILKSAFTHLGAGYYNCGKGMRHFWTQIFMKIR